MRELHRRLLSATQIPSLFVVLSIFSLIAPGSRHSLYAEKTTVRIGILAHRGLPRIYEDFTPTLEQLNRSIPGYRFEAVPFLLSETDKTLSRTDLDFLIANPAIYVLAESRYGASRIATMEIPSGRGRRSSFSTVIFKRKDLAGIDTISDLKGRSIAAPDATSFGGWIAALRELKRAGVQTDDLSRIIFVGTHEAVIHAVLTGTADAGVVRTGIIESLQSETFSPDDLTVINEQLTPGMKERHSSTLYPEWAFAAMPGTPTDLARSVTLSLLQLNTAGIGWVAPADYREVHACLRELALEPYEPEPISLRQFLHDYDLYLIGIALAVLLVLSLWTYRSYRLNRSLKDMRVELTSRTDYIDQMYRHERYLRQALQTVADINQLLVTETDLPVLLQKCCDRLAEHSHYTMAWIGFVDGQECRIAYHSEDHLRYLEVKPQISLDPKDPLSRGPAGRALLDNHPYIINDITTAADFMPWKDRALQAGIQAVACYPLRPRSDLPPIGLLTIYSRRERGFDSEEAGMLEELAGDIGFAINAFRIREDLQRIEMEKFLEQEEVIETFARLIEQRDSYTAGHQSRVARYSELIALELGLSSEQIQLLTRAARLHDVGKVSTPDSILLKPGPLDPYEHRLIRMHVDIGVTMLSGTPLYRNLAEIIRYHHEHFDGSGYPKGARGRQIPLLARILTIADAFDAMTTSRIYRPRKTVNDALDEIERLAGSRYDPEIVPAVRPALADVTVDESIHQEPATMLEQERFAFFFRDQLTRLYNEKYLAYLEKKGETPALSKQIDLQLHGFHSYNRRLSWHEGDVLLQRVAGRLRELYPDCLCFRIQGDDFLLFLNDVRPVPEETQFDEELAGTGVTIDISPRTP
ncbi:HD domain-containing phosphohydrolase [Leptonema illini]|uniref:Metal dependent phosphohydrolase with GAF sensor n=1 Tax=Leptonema illini DSM 21528 TaxID=929563 RepID=H2CBT6_9LEPT|nr:HD domain-containing phosphohydrolase [Leptonema illini]EHQ08540.1 metal dependent phosphohydrolase with GAF sensor [Leptonema illini DSM 21528]